MGKDYYKTLGVDKGASQDDIKKAFRKKAHEYHPDKASGDEQKFKEINEAYQVLGDQNKRAQYDQFGSAFENRQAHGGAHGFDGFRDFSGFANGHNVDFDDLGDIFGGLGDIFGFGGGAKKQTSRKGRDLQMVMTIDFKEAVFGIEKEVSLRKTVKCGHCKGNGAEPGTKIETCKTCGGSGSVMKVQRTILGNIQVKTACHDCQGEGKKYTNPCSKCSGSGVVNENVNLRIKIPAGINDGETIRLTGEGEAGAKGAPAGDLYLKIKVKPDSRFKRDGYDIKTKVEISFTQAALGDKIEIETIDGLVNLKIPEGTQGGTIFKLSGQGVFKLQGGGAFGAKGKRGDHYVEVIVNIPKKLTKKQKKLLQEFDNNQ